MAPVKAPGRGTSTGRAGRPRCQRDAAVAAATVRAIDYFAMAERDYGHRSAVDKLGIKLGHAVAFATEGGERETLLRQQVLDRAGRPPAAAGEPVDAVIEAVEAGTAAVAVLERWRPRLRPNGGIWLLTPKRGRPGYLDQRDLIAAGLAAGLVDNKSCSVSDTTSAIRFVIRRRDRPSEPRP